MITNASSAIHPVMASTKYVSTNVSTKYVSALLFGNDQVATSTSKRTDQDQPFGCHIEFD